MFFELREEIERVDGAQLVEVGGAKCVEDFAINRGKQRLLFAGAIRKGRRPPKLEPRRYRKADV